MSREVLNKAKARTFHGHLDSELSFHSSRVVESEDVKYFIIQHRDLSYRFTLHQHPHVQPLVQRLLRKGSAGLQAADTGYNTRIKLANQPRPRMLLAGWCSLGSETSCIWQTARWARWTGVKSGLPGSKVVRLLEDTPVTSAANKAVTIPRKTIVRRSTGSGRDHGCRYHGQPCRWCAAASVVCRLFRSCLQAES